MPSIFEDPPPLSTIRERALKSALKRRADATAKLAALQEYQSAGLSPLEIELSAQREAYYQNVSDHSSDLIKQIRKQNADIEEDRRRRPLKPLSDRSDLFYRRSEFDRNAAILGILERERRHNAPLSREAYARAKAKAASRSRYDLYRSMRGDPNANTARSVVKGMFAKLQGVDVAPGEVDPCVDYCRKQKNRREVMFAKKLAGRGYRVRHRPSDCVCP